MSVTDAFIVVSLMFLALGFGAIALMPVGQLVIKLAAALGIEIELY